MKRVYWDNTYLFEHEAVITEIGTDHLGTYLRLNETIFHPQGGGQPSDEGTINGVPVIKLLDLRDIEQINHYVGDASNFKVGDRVQLKIDKEKRLEYAALHTAGHVVGGVLRFDFEYKQVLGANHFPKQGKVEYKLDGKLVDKEDFCQRVKKVCSESRKVTESYDANKRRIIHIEGLGEEPCSGTHVHFTNEIDSETFQIRKIESKGGRLKVGYDAAYKH